MQRAPLVAAQSCVAVMPGRKTRPTCYPSDGVGERQKDIRIVDFRAASLRGYRARALPPIGGGVPLPGIVCDFAFFRVGIGLSFDSRKSLMASRKLSRVALTHSAALVLKALAHSRSLKTSKTV